MTRQGPRLFGKLLLCLMAFCLMIQGIFASSASADILVDNGSTGTSFTGTWPVSAGTDPYGSDSLWSRDGTTYTWEFSSQPSGYYEVLMRWSGLSSRASIVPVEVQHADGKDNLFINQKENAGTWNSLGTFYFNGEGSVTVVSAYGSSVSTCADAVWFKYIPDNKPAAAVPPEEADISALAAGDPSLETIIDNSGAGTSFTGTWPVSGATGAYGANSLWSRDGTTYTWSFSPPASASYEVSMWWTQYSSRSSSIPVRIEYYSNGIAATTTTINQQTNGSRWNTLGTYYFASGRTYRITITSQPAPASTCADAVRFVQSPGQTPNAENIYLCDGYSKGNVFLPRCYDYLRGIGATEQNGMWVYRNAAKGITYNIYSVRTPAAMAQALREQGSHIIFNGHSNYGFGAIFATSKELQNQQIDNLYYVDDDRFANYSTRMVSCKADGMRYGQAFPNWNPFFKSGRSALMPYTFSQGTPPYNYYLTYTIPGDPTTYRIELSDGSYLQRFPDSNTPAWYSPSGALPSTVSNQEYFITNSDPDFNRCDFTGNWTVSKTSDGSGGYRGYNFQYRNAGTGENRALYTIYIRRAGNYNVSASWYASTGNATNARFSIRHAGGTSQVVANQQQTRADRTNPLGSYYFNQGTTTVELTDNANGRVIADMIMLSYRDNPSYILQAEFDADKISGGAPLAVQFTDRSTAYNTNLTGRLWNFGDGTTSTERNPQHTYTRAGSYTVSLQITDAAGRRHTETKEGLIAANTTASLNAEFTAPSRRNSGRTIVEFKDMSSGNITSRRWEFGDGTTSTERNPVHVYRAYGSFTVRLTVSGPNGSDIETETAYVNNLVATEYVDNAYHEKPHYYTGSSSMSGKIICDTGPGKIPSSEMRYARMFYGGCNSSNYYAGAFNRGIYFFTRDDAEEVTGPEYLRRYLLGDTDAQILARLNSIEPIYEYYNFNLKPPSMR